MSPCGNSRLDVTKYMSELSVYGGLPLTVQDMIKQDRAGECMVVCELGAVSMRVSEGEKGLRVVSVSVSPPPPSTRPRAPEERAGLLLRLSTGSGFVNGHQSLLSVSPITPNP